MIFGFLPPWHALHFRGSDGTAQLISHLFLVHNLAESTYFAINGTFWSIAIEVQLYLLYPLLLWLARTLTWNQTLWITFLIESAVRLYACIYAAVHHIQPTGWITGLPFGYWFSWATGAAAAEAFLQGNALPFSRIPIWLIILFSLGVSAFEPIAPFGFLLQAMATVRVIAWCLAKPGPGDRLGHSWPVRHPRFAGVVSYSGYLLHLPLLSTLTDRLTNSPWHFSPFVVFVLVTSSWFPVLGLAWCFYRVLELPSIALGKRIAGERSKPKSA